MIKTSAVKAEHRIIEAPALVFEDQDDLLAAYKRGELNSDFIAVVRFQGPQANGMPELHNLTPPLGVLLDKGFKVALVTDGRMSGAVGQGPGRDPRDAGGRRRRAAGLCPRRRHHPPRRRGRRAEDQGRSGRADAPGRRPPRRPPAAGYGRELFGWMRRAAGPADAGACTLFEAAW